MKKKRIVIAVFLVLLIGVGALVYWGQWRNQRQELSYSGTIEATNANLAFQAPGRIVRVAVKEGEAVAKDQVLAELDPSELKARQDQAKANLERARRVQEQAGTMQSLYRETLPADVLRAEANLKALRSASEDSRKNAARYEQLFSRGVVTEKERDTVRLRADTDRERLAEAEAVLVQAKSNLKKIDAAQKDMEGARSAAEAARATLDQAVIQSGYAKLSAPFAGIVTSRNVEPGEVVTAGREVLTVTDLSTVDLKIFVGETEIGKVKPGQRVEVKVDTFPKKTFEGRVTFISPEGEFTPKIIQTKKERVKLVYLVKVSVPNPDLELKSGMPADAWLK
ncbi:MAG: HlyD family secretion protein [Syntrophales bacterium]